MSKKIKVKRLKERKYIGEKTDKYNDYYTFYVDKQFDEKEVWDILDTAYKKAEEQRKIDKIVKESTKRSVLEDK